MVEELEDKSVERPVNTQFLRRFSKTDVSATLPLATSVLRGCKFFFVAKQWIVDEHWRVL